MRERFEKVSDHKGLYIRIDESPIFTCHIQQYFIEDMEQFKKGIYHDNESSVLVGFSYDEFCIIAEEIFAYRKELEESSKLVKKLTKKVLSEIQ
jgi:hypothetical protein